MCWLTFLKSFASVLVAYPTVKCQACNTVNSCSAVSVLSPCSSQCLCFVGKCWQDFRACYAPLCALSPSVCCRFCFSSIQALFGMQVSGVEKLRAETSYCPFPTHPSSPPASHNHLLPKGSWHTGWDRIYCLARDFVFFSWQRCETRAAMPFGGFKFQGIHFLKPCFASLREFSPSFECHRGMQVCWHSPLLKNRPHFVGGLIVFPPVLEVYLPF